MQHRQIAKRFWHQGNGLSLDTAAIEKYKNDIIDLSIGDCDFITDRRIIDSAYADVCNGHTRYGDPKGDPELIAAIQRAYKEDFSLDISRENICVSTSSCIGMSLAMAAILNPGDEVLVFAPYFTLYKMQAELVGGVIVEVPTSADDSFAIHEEAVRAAITPRTKAIIFNNPTNPTGMAYGRDTLIMLANICKEYDLIMAADEIYTRYMFDGEFTPICTLPGMAERTITLNSFSKNFMMTGWRVGFIIAPAHIISTIMYINNAYTYTSPAPSQRAAIAALALRDSIQEKYISQYRERVYYSADRLSAMPYISVVQPKGTFYIFPGIQKTGLTSAEFCDKLLNEAHILVTPGSAFGAAGEGHFRIACTTGMDKLKEAYDRMDRLKF